MDLYAENILDHAKHPRNAGSLPHPSVRHHEENASCGDDIEIDLTISHERITDIKWHGEGCALSQAGMSLLSEELIGMNLDDAYALDTTHMNTLLGVPVGPRRFKCAFLALHTLKNALRKYQNQGVQTWLETVKIDNDE